jgi:Replication-relaxation
MARSLVSQTPSKKNHPNLRPRVSKELISRAARSVTPRDKRICLDIYEHRFLTTHQVCRLHFTSAPRARNRLHGLWQLRVLDRFQPERPTGSHPFYYVLDEVGIHIVAAQLGVAPKKLVYDRGEALAQVYSPHLLHHTEVNDFFTRLAEETRRTSGHRLHSWLGERGCRQMWRELIRPDGYGLLEARGRRVSFLLELDGGTEIRSRLARKLEALADLAGTPEAPDGLILCFPSSDREASARAVLEEPGIVVATGVLREHLRNPLGEVWLPLGARRRRRLVDLVGHGSRSLSA